MLKAHLAAIEKSIICKAEIQANVGHSLHKGTPRELFIKEFLSSHSSETVSFGTGEIIDADSRPSEKRNQIDIVIHKKEYPRLDFTGGISGFLSESVVAAIEVKSTLDEEAFRDAYKSAINCKKLKRAFIFGPKNVVRPTGNSKLHHCLRWACKNDHNSGLDKEIGS